MNNRLYCAHCGKPHHRSVGERNRAATRGLRLFCGRRCFGLDRRKWKTKAQKKREKRLYDIAYRRKNRAMLKAKKQAYHKRTYDPAKAASERKAKMARHVEYCRRPAYKAYKRAADAKRRATDLRYRYKLPPHAPDSLVETVTLTRALKKEIYSEHR